MCIIILCFRWVFVGFRITAVFTCKLNEWVIKKKYISTFFLLNWQVNERDAKKSLDFIKIEFWYKLGNIFLQKYLSKKKKKTTQCIPCSLMFISHRGSLKAICRVARIIYDLLDGPSKKQRQVT